MKKLIFIVFFCLLSTVSSHAVFAARSITFTTDKASLKGDDELTITASASGFNTGEEIYIKGSFNKEGSDSYFGYTKKDGSWVKTLSSSTDQLKVKIGEWNNQVTVKNDYGAKGFTDHGNGTFQFRIRFYTIKNGNEIDDSYWSGNTVSVSLESPPPTNTPTITPTRTPTPNPTTVPTSTPNPTAVPTKNTTPTKTPAPTSKTTPTETPEPTNGEVLGEETTPSPTESVTPTPTPGVQTKGPNMAIALGFVGAGTGILAIMSIVSIIRKRKKEREYIIEE